jgi:hypothetical protein
MGFSDETLIPAFAGGFFCGVADGAILHFIYGSNGKITGIDVMNRHMRKITFARSASSLPGSNWGDYRSRSAIGHLSLN